MVKYVKENRMPVHEGEKKLYDIVFNDSFDAICDEISALGRSYSRICVITDSNVSKLYLDEVTGKLSESFPHVTSYTIQAGEESKTLDNIRCIYRHLIEEHFDRHDLIIALGGGVIGDMSGFAAATYLRGIDYIQMPTTLLAQSDSSIGGKCGVDLDGYKNMVGAFKMPVLVYMNLSTLNTLDGRQFYSGFAEVMKCGLIRDDKFYIWLIDHMYEIHERDLETLKVMVYNNCLIKRKVVEADPYEQGERAILNFGHTIGHAIERARNFELLHGECVALGCVAAAFISWTHGLISMEVFYEIRDMFVPFNLPISVEDIDPEEILRITRSDKKMSGDHLRFILLDRIGNASIKEDVTDKDILDAIDQILWKEDSND